MINKIQDDETWTLNRAREKALFGMAVAILNFRRDCFESAKLGMLHYSAA
jgi:hypothetical protein